MEEKEDKDTPGTSHRTHGKIFVWKGLTVLSIYIEKQKHNDIIKINFPYLCLMEYEKKKRFSNSFISSLNVCVFVCFQIFRK